MATPRTARVSDRFFTQSCSHGNPPDRFMATFSGSFGGTMTAVTCRLCDARLIDTLVDLGMSPLCESYLTEDRLDQPESFYPLNVRLCEQCLLVQLPAYVSGADIFSDYAYFSSYSTSWVEHARRYATQMVDSLGLGPDR